jgi:hypothetical protein
MFAIIALVLIVFLALAVLGLVAHLLFSPWLLLLGVVGIVAWIKLRPGRSRSGS